MPSPPILKLKDLIRITAFTEVEGFRKEVKGSSKEVKGFNKEEAFSTEEKGFSKEVEGSPSLE